MLEAAQLLHASCLELFSHKGFCCSFAHTLIPFNWGQHQLQSLWPPPHPCAENWWILIEISQGILQSLKVTLVLLHLLPSLNKCFKLDDSSGRFYSDTSSIHFPALLNHKALDSFPGIRSKISSGYIDHSTNCIMKAALHQSSSKSLLSLGFCMVIIAINIGAIQIPHDQSPRLL